MRTNKGVRMRFSFPSLLFATTLAVAGCGGSSTTNSPPPPPTRTVTPTQAPTQQAAVPSYATHFTPVSQDTDKPARLVAAFRSNYDHAVIAYAFNKTLVRDSYLGYILGAAAAAKALQDISVTNVLVLRLNEDKSEFGSAGSVHAYLTQVSRSYRIREVSHPRHGQIVIEVVETNPAASGATTDVTMTFARSRDRFAGRYVLANFEPH